MGSEYPEGREGGFQITADIRLRHGKLFLWMRENHMTNALLSRTTGIPAPKIGLIVNLQTLPNEKEMAILEALTNIPSEELFPDEYRKAIRPGKTTKAQRRFITKSIPLKEMLDWQSHEALPAPDDIINQVEMIEIVDRAKNEMLNEREKNIIDMRFGLNGEGPRTLDDIAEGMGVKAERIRQIERTALCKLYRGLQGKNQ